MVTKDNAELCHFDVRILDGAIYLVCGQYALVDPTELAGGWRDSCQGSFWRAAMKPVWAQFTDDIGQDLIDAALSNNSGV